MTTSSSYDSFMFLVLDKIHLFIDTTDVIRESVNEVHIECQRIKSRKSTEYITKKYINNKLVLQKISFLYTLT